MARFNWSKVQRHCRTDAWLRSVDYQERFKEDDVGGNGKPVMLRLRRRKHKKSSGNLHNEAMKLASKLYQRLQSEPDFKNEDKKTLWAMAVESAKQKFGI